MLPGHRKGIARAELGKVQAKFVEQSLLTMVSNVHLQGLQVSRRELRQAQSAISSLQCDLKLKPQAWPQSLPFPWHQHDTPIYTVAFVGACCEIFSRQGSGQSIAEEDFRHMGPKRGSGFPTPQTLKFWMLAEVFRISILSG